MSSNHHAPAARLAPGAAVPAPDASAERTPQRVDILGPHCTQRAEVEAFIHRDYARAYDADIRHFLPWLMHLRSGDGTLRAALGFRRAQPGPLFLEQYLDQPIEAALGARIADTVTRARLIEVGNLAVAEAGGARWLIAALTAYLKAAGFDWAVFTGVTALRNAFARLGVTLTTLAPADVARLPLAERGQWGRYYDTAPMVVAANVHQSYAALWQSLGLAEQRHRLRPMWDSAYTVGRATAA
jgi:hypothetical protein